MNLLLGIPAGLLMIGVLVVIHEFGHFLFAKFFGIGAPVFSVGMGHRLFGFEYKGTDFRLSALPLGGYVQLAGVDPFGEVDPDGTWVDPKENFMNRPVYQRLLVMVAGPLFNLILPIPLFVLVFMAGQPARDTTIGHVIPGTPAAEAGIQPGDALVSVDDAPIEVWQDLLRIRGSLVDQAVSVQIERDGAVQDLQLPAGAFQVAFDGELDAERLGIQHAVPSARIGVDDVDSPAGRAGLKTGDLILSVDGEPIEDWYGLAAALADGEAHEVDYKRGSRLPKPGEPGKTEVKVEEGTATLAPDPSWTAPADDPAVDPVYGILPAQHYAGPIVDDSPAEAAGLEAGDRLFAVDGSVVRSWAEITWLVQRTVDVRGAEAEPRALELTLVRDGERVTKTFTPELKREVVRGEPRWRPIMGVYPYPDAFLGGDTRVYRYGLVEAVPMAVGKTQVAMKKVFRILGYLVTNQLKPKEAVGGPVAMVQLATRAVEYGILPLIETAAMISVSLGIVNLLPVPVLDGGHIVFYAIEGLRGRPLPLALRERIQMVGVLVLSVVMLLVIVMDISRWLEGGIGS